MQTIEQIEINKHDDVKTVRNIYFTIGVMEGFISSDAPTKKQKQACALFQEMLEMMIQENEHNFQETYFHEMYKKILKL